MREAFLPGHGMVLASEVFDTDAPFRCPYCGVRLKLKSVNGKVAPYFGRQKITDEHGADCPYVLSCTSVVNSGRLKKASLEEILFTARKSPAVFNTGKSADKSSVSSPGNSHIRTPKQLYNFCQSNTCRTEYRDGLLVDDILLSNRNIDMHDRISGITGIRLVVGVTYRYEAVKHPYLY